MSQGRIWPVLGENGCHQNHLTFPESAFTKERETDVGERGSRERERKRDRQEDIAEGSSPKRIIQAIILWDYTCTPPSPSHTHIPMWDFFHAPEELIDHMWCSELFPMDIPQPHLHTHWQYIDIFHFFLNLTKPLEYFWEHLGLLELWGLLHFPHP